jgi:hypothetical protein
MPKIDNVFGPRGPGVSAADASAAVPPTVFPSSVPNREAASTPAAAGGEVAPLPPIPPLTTSPGQAVSANAAAAAVPSAAIQSEAAAQPVNIRIDLTITDQRERSTSAPKTVTLLLQDREEGRLRTEQEQVNARLAVDARPEILANGRIRVVMMLEYRPQAADGDRVLPSTFTESVTAIVEDGKPLVVSQSADPTSNGVAVKVELKATVLR